VWDEKTAMIWHLFTGAGWKTVRKRQERLSLSPLTFFQSLCAEVQGGNKELCAEQQEALFAAPPPSVCPVKLSLETLWTDAQATVLSICIINQMNCLK